MAVVRVETRKVRARWIGRYGSLDLQDAARHVLRSRQAQAVEAVDAPKIVQSDHVGNELLGDWMVELHARVGEPAIRELLGLEIAVHQGRHHLVARRGPCEGGREGCRPRRLAQSNDGLEGELPLALGLVGVAHQSRV